MSFSYSFDEEYYIGSFESPEGAAIEALSENPEYNVVYVGENVQRKAEWFVSAERILEDAFEQAYEECGECSEDWLNALMRDKEAKAELEKLVGAWIDSKEPINFWTVSKILEFTREDLESRGLLEKV